MLFKFTPFTSRQMIDVCWRVSLKMIVYIYVNYSYKLQVIALRFHLWNRIWVLFFTWSHCEDIFSNFFSSLWHPLKCKNICFHLILFDPILEPRQCSINAHLTSTFCCLFEELKVGQNLVLKLVSVHPMLTSIVIN